MRSIFILTFALILASCGAEETSICYDINEFVTVCDAPNLEFASEIIDTLDKMSEKFLSVGLTAHITVNFSDDVKDNARGFYADNYNTAYVSKVYDETACVEHHYIMIHEMIHHILHTGLGNTDVSHSNTMAWDGVDLAMYEIIADKCSKTN